MIEEIEAVMTNTAAGEIYFEYDKADEGSLWEPLNDVNCVPNHRFCSVYGVSTVVCICKTDPVHKMNIAMVRQYCYFATTEVSKMSNSWKRNMLYWWYMTNTYNICGKGTRAELHTCLKAAIRKAYPSERDDGMYMKYSTGSNSYSGKTKVKVIATK